MAENLANLFAQKFIARPDVKAMQLPSDGSWIVHTENRKRDGARIPWRREDLNAHLEGTATFGHYLLSSENQCKLFAFDIDLTKDGNLPTLPFPAYDDETLWAEWEHSFKSVQDLRGAWLDRKHVAREWMKLQFKELAHKLMSAIVDELQLPCAAAYSGGKGVHVYAFTGLIDAWEAVEGSQIVLDAVGDFKATRGSNFFHHRDYFNLSIETFPKQKSLDGKDLGNLMRLPLGKNLKAPKEPTFFIDMTSPMGQMVPMDAEIALTLENPWIPF